MHRHVSWSGADPVVAGKADDALRCHLAVLMQCPLAAGTHHSLLQLTLSLSAAPTWLQLQRMDPQDTQSEHSETPTTGTSVLTRWRSKNANLCKVPSSE